MWRHHKRRDVLAAGGARGGLALPVAGDDRSAGPEVVALIQIGRQFLQSESGADHGLDTRGKADCEAINAKAGTKRMVTAGALELEPGAQVLRVRNPGVPHELGFWLREADDQLANPLHEVTELGVAGGGLGTGQTKDDAVELAPGEYLYSCPLNRTPDCRLLVEG